MRHRVRPDMGCNPAAHLVRASNHSLAVSLQACCTRQLPTRVAWRLTSAVRAMHACLCVLCYAATLPAQHMRSYLAPGAAGAWDVLIGHGLGVDHAGHAHGVCSTQMLAKVTQMDALVEEVAGETPQHAGLSYKLSLVSCMAWRGMA